MVENIDFSSPEPSAIDPDRSQLLDPQHQSTFDRFLKSTANRNTSAQCHAGHPNSRQRSGLRRSHVALLRPSPIAIAISRFCGQIRDRSGHIIRVSKTALTPPAKELESETHINAHFKRTDNVSTESSLATLPPTAFQRKTPAIPHIPLNSTYAVPRNHAFHQAPRAVISQLGHSLVFGIWAPGHSARPAPAGLSF